MIVSLLFCIISLTASNICFGFWQLVSSEQAFQGTAFHNPKLSSRTALVPAHATMNFTGYLPPLQKMIIHYSYHVSAFQPHYQSFF